jgi:hypothetical protein
MRKIDWVKKWFIEDGLRESLTGKRCDRTYERKIDGDFEARLIALSCSQPPMGHSRCSLRLLAYKAFELQ